MHKLIKDGALVDNNWEVADLDVEDNLPEGNNVLVPLKYWNAHRSDIQAGEQRTGVVLQPDETPDQISGDLADIPVIAINFPGFADGRGFSIARLLRERHGFAGELRAIGAPIRDQLTYLSRVGFNAFQLAEHYDPAEALASLHDFRDNYQASADQPVPLFRRHKHPGAQQPRN